MKQRMVGYKCQICNQVFENYGKAISHKCATRHGKKIIRDLGAVEKRPTLVDDDFTKAVVTASKDIGKDETFGTAIADNFMRQANEVSHKPEQSKTSIWELFDRCFPEDVDAQARDLFHAKMKEYYPGGARSLAKDLRKRAGLNLSYSLEKYKAMKRKASRRERTGHPIPGKKVTAFKFLNTVRFFAGIVIPFSIAGIAMLGTDSVPILVIAALVAGVITGFAMYESNTDSETAFFLGLAPVLFGLMIFGAWKLLTNPFTHVIGSALGQYWPQTSVIDLAALGIGLLLLAAVYVVIPSLFGGLGGYSSMHLIRKYGLADRPDFFGRMQAASDQTFLYECGCGLVFETDEAINIHKGQTGHTSSHKIRVAPDMGGQMKESVVE